LPLKRHRDDGGSRHPEDDAGVAEGRLEPHRSIELRPLELAADPSDPDRVIETRSDSGEGDEQEQDPEGRGQGNQSGAESEDDDPEREESRRVPTIRHRAEDHLKDGGHEERGATEEAGLEGAEREMGLQEGNLARDHSDRAIVREMIQGIREEDPTIAGHDAAMTERLKSLGPVGNDRRGRAAPT